MPTPALPLNFGTSARVALAARLLNCISHAEGRTTAIAPKAVGITAPHDERGPGCMMPQGSAVIDMKILSGLPQGPDEFSLPGIDIAIVLDLAKQGLVENVRTGQVEV